MVEFGSAKLEVEIQNTCTFAVMCSLRYTHLSSPLYYALRRHKNICPDMIEKLLTGIEQH